LFEFERQKQSEIERQIAKEKDDKLLIDDNDSDDKESDGF